MLTGVLIVQLAVTEEDAGMTTGILFIVGIIFWSAAAVVLAWPPARPGTFWQRRNAVDPTGRRLLNREPGTRRLARTVAGALLGMAPAVAFMVIVVATLEGDDAQLGFIGIPLAFLGLVLGAWIGSQCGCRDRHCLHRPRTA